MSFATKTIDQHSNRIQLIEQQIAELQQALTEAQNELQQLKSAEQAGVSAIAQFKEAYKAIASMQDRELATKFLDSFKDAIEEVEQEQRQAVKALPEAIDIEAQTENEPVPLTPTAPIEGVEEPEQEASSNAVLTYEDFMRLSYQDLQAVCKALGMKAKGTKSILATLASRKQLTQQQLDSILSLGTTKAA